jgi:hypothetical protein
MEASCCFSTALASPLAQEFVSRNRTGQDQGQHFQAEVQLQGHTALDSRELELQKRPMLHFSSTRADWRLDAVSILAILGESNIKLNSHLITSTRLCYLPRLMPAPQGLLGERRMKQLPREEDVKVAGVANGNESEGLNYFATLLHEKALQDPSFTVRTVDIYSDYLPKHRTEVDIRRRDFGPVNVITVGSFVLTMALLLYALALGDGPGFIGVSVMSLTSTLLCAASHWKPTLPTRTASRNVIPKGDVVIRTRKGSFIFVHCNEIIARKLYFAPEECEYRMSSTAGRATGGLAGGLVMMGAVILFGNCSWPLQVALGVSYAVLNAAYWSTTVCPSSWTWDFSDFKVSDRGIVQNKNYTGALATAIRQTRTTKWVLEANFSPNNAAWRDWLKQADLNMENDRWWRDSSQDTSLRPSDRTHFQGTLTWLLDQHRES